ncbi:amino acid adenylation domain-containing protein [Acidovorax sp. NCPPB 2350]|nr:amino acid adenylation domain-containing protein [Acidovorax sp. NCPPB 2350]
MEHLARERTDEVWLVVAGDAEDGGRETSYTYGQFAGRVHGMAARLQRTVAPGERVLVMLENSVHYAVAMLACFHAGMVAVPVFPPESNRPQHLARLAGIAEDSGAGAVICLRAVAEGVRESGVFGRVRIIEADTLDEGEAGQWRRHVPHADDIAFLQYTSGSTSAPKGVMVSHGNLMANERAIQDLMDTSPEDKFVCWSPLYHDMGLIGGLLQPLYRGAELILTSPRYFLERPNRWLELVSRHRATISGGPDFAYRLCLERAKESQMAGLDLSSWRMAYTGAEPVRSDTMAAFSQRFAAAGFNPAAIYACYGLAEATLMVTGGRRGSGMLARGYAGAALDTGRAEPDVQGRSLVACGAAPAHHEVRIVDPQALVHCADRQVGEIWLAGPSVAQGYWNNAEATRNAFHEQEGRRWLRTGDLGFLDGGQLYVTGRIKDLIIVRGHNLYPQDIERVVEDGVPAVRKGRVAVFAVDGPGGEGVGIAAEVSRSQQKQWPAARLVRAVAEVVAEAIAAPPAVVVLLHPGALPKTSSGKLQRNACRQGWAERSLDAYAIFERGTFVLGGDPQALDGGVTAPADSLELALAEIWAEALARPASQRVGRETHFFAEGGNSLSAVQVTTRIAARWSVNLPLAALFEAPRLGDFALRLRSCLEAPQQGRAPALRAGLAPAGARHALSAAQERLWFLQRLQPDSSAYHVALGLDLEGRLDGEALRDALARLVERHEILRTVFPADAQGAPYAEVLAPQAVGPWMILVPDSALAGDAGRAQALQKAFDLNLEPFDLARAPLLRAALVPLGPERHRLVLVLHHIIADAHTLGLLLAEMADHYRRRVAGEAQDPSAPPLQYRDYVAWQRDWLNDEVRAAQCAYWTARLGQDHPVLALTPDRPRAPVASYRPAEHGCILPADLVAALREQASGHDATLPMVLLAAFQVLLYRYTGMGQIRVGLPIAGRHADGAAYLPGMFVNTVVMANAIDGATRLDATLAATREAAIGAQAHQDLPFDELVQALNPPRSLMHPPLFQVLYNHLHEDLRHFERLTGLRARTCRVPAAIAQFELTLETRERPGGEVDLRLIHAEALYAPDTMARFAEHYLAVLRAFSRAPECRVADIALLSAFEQAAMARWATHEYALEPGLVHRQIEAQAQRTPDAVAVVFGGQTLSYAELNARANRLAHALMERGVEPESLVGVALERSVELVVALLGVMKAGGAYVPIDAELPQERVAYMLGDSGVRRVVSDARTLQRLSLPEGVEVLRLAGQALDGRELEGWPESEPQVRMHPEHLAYVIYTSGSSGRPKGAANRHGALHNRLEWMQAQYGLQAQDVVLQKTPFSFDVSVWEFFWPLMVGAKLVVAQPGAHRDPVELAKLIRQEGVSTLHFVPSMLQAFLADGAGRGCDTVRRVVCSGEALPGQVQEQVWEQMPGAGLYNLYGPTEAAIDVTQWECRRDGRTQVAMPVAIGRPIWNTQCRVLDGEMNEVPQGVAGELYLGGAGLARGYARRPGLTAERFVADAQEAGQRLYRTGDLVRWREDGELEYLGRLDQQVKIRGLRIELGEIEAVLLEQRGVEQAVVVAQTQEGTGARLVAYVAPAGLDGQALRRALEGRLPEYMVPWVVQVLEELPLNANGKIDRKALPAVQGQVSGGYEAPRGEVEEALAGIWAQVLGLERVGRLDNFFELGGHSLLATRIVAAVRRQLGRDIGLEQMFTHPQLGALAQWLQSQSTVLEGAWWARDIEVPEQAALSYAQQRLWFLWKLDPAGTAMNIPSAFVLSGALDEAALAAALRALVDRHEMLRTVFGENDGQAWQRVLPPGALAVSVERGEAGADPQAWQAVARRCAAQPFDLAHGPLLRMRLARIDAETHLLVVVAHHIVADGWSSKVMLADFLRLYEAACAAQPPSLEPPPWRYAAYAATQRHWLEGGEMERQAGAWRAALAGVEPLVLEPDLPLPGQRRHPLQTCAFSLDEALTLQIAHLTGGMQATPYMLLLAATSLALSARGRQRRFYVGTDVANREVPSTQGMVGFFVNQLAVPVDCGTALTGQELLEQVRMTVLAAAGRQDLPFDKLVAALGSRTRGGRAPLFQVKVIHQDGLQAPAMPALIVEPVPVHGEQAELDLIVSYLSLSGRIEATLLYDAECYEAAGMASLGQEILAVIERLAREPAVSIEALYAQAQATHQAIRERQAGEREARMGALRDGLKRRRTHMDTGR